VAETTKSRKRTKLTPKQAKFVKGVIEGKTMVKAAMDAYPTVDYKSASVMAAQNLEKVSIKEALAGAYDRAGITADRIARKLSDHMDAKKVVYIESDSDDYKERERVEVPDYTAQINAVRVAAQLIGLGTKDSDGNAGTTVNFNFGSKKYN
jgi:phage terminase small subunit